jgi:transposase
MARAQKEQLRVLTPEEQTALQRIIQASSERVDRARRARALLAVAQGQPLAQAARQAGLRSGSTVAGLVQRFNQRGMTALSIATGRGRKATYGGSGRPSLAHAQARAHAGRQRAGSHAHRAAEPGSRDRWRREDLRHRWGKRGRAAARGEFCDPPHG